MSAETPDTGYRLAMDKAWSRVPNEAAMIDAYVAELRAALSDSQRRERELREAAALAGHYVGCGDNSCLFVKPKGMGTNGGCRCSRRPGAIDALAKLYRLASLPPTSTEEKP